MQLTVEQIRRYAALLTEFADRCEASNADPEYTAMLVVDNDNKIIEAMGGQSPCIAEMSLDDKNPYLWIRVETQS